MDTSPGSASRVDLRSPATILEALYRDSYSHLVRIAALLLGGDVGRAEEIVQEMFVDLHRRWDRLRDREHLAAYAKVAVAHAAVSELRHRRVAERHRPEPIAVVDSAESGALERVRRREVMSALGRLPERQRQVLILRFYGQLSEAEVAGAIGISRGAVKSHTARAFKTLRTILEAQS